MVNPQQPGTAPQGLGDPLDGAPVWAPEFQFGRAASGPFGRPPRDPSQGSGDVERPLWPVFLGSNVRRTIELIESGPISSNRFTFYNPVFLYPYIDATNIPTSIEDLEVYAEPWKDLDVSPTGDAGYYAGPGRLYLPYPGEWRVRLTINGAGSPTKMTFIVVDVTNPQLAKMFMDYQRPRRSQQNVIALAAATGATLIEIENVLQACAIRVSNTGANPARLRWRSDPTATLGTPLAPEESILYEARTIPAQRLRGFSTLGTTISWDLYEYVS